MTDCSELSGVEDHAGPAHHPLARFGYSAPPPWLWGASPGTYVFVAALKDIWLIATGALTLHKAWQAGYDDKTRAESLRAARGGR